MKKYVAPLHTLYKGCPIWHKIQSKSGLDMTLDEEKIKKIWSEKDKKKGEKNRKEGRKEKGKHVMLVLKSGCLCVEH